VCVVVVGTGGVVRHTRLSWWLVLGADLLLIGRFFVVVHDKGNVCVQTIQRHLRYTYVPEDELVPGYHLEYCNVDVHDAKVSLPSCMHDYCTDNPSPSVCSLGSCSAKACWLHIVLWHCVILCPEAPASDNTCVDMYDRTYLALAGLIGVTCHSVCTAVAQRG